VLKPKASQLHWKVLPAWTSQITRRKRQKRQRSKQNKHQPSPPAEGVTATTVIVNADLSGPAAEVKRGSADEGEDVRHGNDAAGKNDGVRTNMLVPNSSFQLK
jgi:hypothetical protein